MSRLSPDDPTRPLSAEERADQVEVPHEFVTALIEFGALEEQGVDTYSRSNVGRVRILHAWQEAGLSTKDIMGLVNAREYCPSGGSTPPS
jgi:hypothetical protein